MGPKFKKWHNPNVGYLTPNAVAIHIFVSHQKTKIRYRNVLFFTRTIVTFHIV